MEVVGTPCSQRSDLPVSYKLILLPPDTHTLQSDVSFHSLSLSTSPSDRQPMASSLSQQFSTGRRKINLRDGFHSLRAGEPQSLDNKYNLYSFVLGPKRRSNHRQLQANRKSMLLSELCVVAVSIPADLAQGQKGCGTVLKFRFSPYTQIEFLRVAILKVGV